MNILHSKCAMVKTVFSDRVSNLFVSTSWKFAQVYRVNYLYIMYVICICVWDRGGHGHITEWSYIKAHGTQCSEENAGKYNRNDDTRLYCCTSCGSAACDKRCQYEKPMGAHCSCSAHALHTHCFCSVHACCVKYVFLWDVFLWLSGRALRLQHKGCGFDSQGTHVLKKICIAWMMYSFG